MNPERPRRAGARRVEAPEQKPSVPGGGWGEDVVILGCTSVGFGRDGEPGSSLTLRACNGKVWQ